MQTQAHGRPAASRGASKPRFASAAPARSGGFRGRPSGASAGPRRFGSSAGPKTFNSRGGNGGGGRGKRGGSFERIDSSRFVKKAEFVNAVPYVSKNTFSDFGFGERLYKNIAKKGFEHPMPIQDQTIPLVMAGQDVFGLANTGTGKTAAFVLPLIEKVLRDKSQRIIILAPTRELALQIEKELQDFTSGTTVFSVSCVGGMPIMRQIRELKRGVSFVIGTPGRVKDLIDRKVLRLDAFKTIVLDEADRMLDMGFRDDMEFIMKGMQANRQTLFFSATSTNEINKLSEKFLNNPARVSVVARETSKNIDQDIIRIQNRDSQIDQLQEVLAKESEGKILIFRETKRDVDRLETELKKRGFSVGAIHGDKRNRERIRVLEDFKRHTITVLIATDVAARGLDIPDVTHVINYDVPQTYDTYVHRIGRTGRGNKTGKAITFVR